MNINPYLVFLILCLEVILWWIAFRLIFKRHLGLHWMLVALASFGIPFLIAEIYFISHSARPSDYRNNIHIQYIVIIIWYSIPVFINLFFVIKCICNGKKAS